MAAAQAQPKAVSPGRPPERALREFIQTFGLLERVMQPYFAQFGISGSHWGVLRNLHRAEQEGLAGLGAAGYGSTGRLWDRHAAVPFRTAEVQRGDLHATISATGTIEPEEVVDVGAQVAGQIKEFGPDPRDSNKRVDYGTPVKVGTVLAKIDDAVYQSQVDQAKAQVAQAQAGLQRAEADLVQMKAKVHQTE